MNANGKRMTSARWLMNRIAAAIAGAIRRVGAGAIQAAVKALSCGPTCTTLKGSGDGVMHCVAYASTCGYFAGDLIFAAIWSTAFAIVLGTLPGLAALTLTPAKRHPWRSLPALVLGTLAGFGIWCCLATLTPTIGEGWGWLLLLAIPSIAGLSVAYHIERLPKPLRP